MIVDFPFLKLRLAIKSRIAVELQKLENAKLLMMQGGKNMLRIHQTKMNHLESMLKAMDPDQVLKRGYTITSHKGQTITSSTVLEEGMEIQTTFQDGSVKSIVA